MIKFLQVIFWAVLAFYGVKEVVHSQSDHIKEFFQTGKIEAAKSFMDSVSDNIEIGSEVIDMSKGDVNIGELYGRAQKEEAKSKDNRSRSPQGFEEIK